jgi:hypothetical protein
MKPGVYITFDVECSMGGAWDGVRRPVPPERGMMGRYGSQSWGLPLICEILAEHGLRATFFLEPFNDELGYEGRTEPVAAFLMDRGQDVQLHVHPGHAHFAAFQAGRPYVDTDDFHRIPPAEQKQLLVDGCDRLEGWTGRRPAAFRAGNMAADEASLAAVAEAGLRIDSSYAFCFAGGQCGFSPQEAYNGSKFYGPVLELALSGFRQRRLPGLHPAKPLDLMGISDFEAREGVELLAAAGLDSVLILHSFSLMKVRDVQYSRARPNRVVIGRFRRFCRWLAGRPDLAARTFSDLDEDLRAGRYAPRSAPPPLLDRPVRALLRKAVQAANRWYWL